MVSFRSLALLSAVGLAAAQEISTLEPCAQSCYGSTRAQFATYGCASADDISCLCSKGDFKAGLESCAKASCADPNYFGTLIAAVNAVCATAVPAPPAAPSTTSAPAAPSTTAPAPTTTEAPPPAATSSSSSLTSSVSTTATHTESAARLTSSTSTAALSTSSATKAATTSHSSTTAAAPAATTSAPPVAAQPEGGLSTATKIGIAVGVTALGLAIIGVIICLLLRRRQNNRNITIQTRDWKISEPMPVAGRAYGHDYSNSYETGLSELEMKSRRYEDMLPRQVPRQMV